MSGHGKKMVTPVIPVSRGSGVVTVARSAIGYDDEEEQEGSPIMSDSGYPLQGFSHKNWRDGLCNCCDCVDCGIWCMTCWCPFQPIAFLWERVAKKKTYLTMLSVLGFVWLVAMGLSGVDIENGDNKALLNFVGHACSFGFWIIAVILVGCVRNNVRKKYGIPETCCPGCEDCCCSLWCLSCTVCQVWRHITGGQAKGAKGCSCKSDPESGCC